MLFYTEVDLKIDLAFTTGLTLAWCLYSFFCTNFVWLGCYDSL